MYGSTLLFASSLFSFCLSPPPPPTPTILPSLLYETCQIHVGLQVLMKSCARFFEFMKRSNAVSPTVALETAAALQVMMSICIAKCSIWN